MFFSYNSNTKTTNFLIQKSILQCKTINFWPLKLYFILWRTYKIYNIFNILTYFNYICKHFEKSFSNSPSEKHVLMFHNFIKYYKVKYIIYVYYITILTVIGVVLGMHDGFTPTQCPLLQYSLFWEGFSKIFPFTQW